MKKQILLIIRFKAAIHVVGIWNYPFFSQFLGSWSLQWWWCYINDLGRYNAEWVYGTLRLRKGNYEGTNILLGYLYCFMCATCMVLLEIVSCSWIIPAVFGVHVLTVFFKMKGVFVCSSDRSPMKYVQHGTERRMVSLVPPPFSKEKT